MTFSATVTVQTNFLPSVAELRPNAKIPDNADVISRQVKLNVDYIPRVELEKYTRESPGKDILALVPPGKTPEQYQHNIGTKFKNVYIEYHLVFMQLICCVTRSYVGGTCRTCWATILIALLRYNLLSYVYDIVCVFTAGLQTTRRYVRETKLTMKILGQSRWRNDSMRDTQAHMEAVWKQHVVHETM